MHHVLLDAMLKPYTMICREKMRVELEHVIVWTDNVTHQYRCCQNFSKVLTVITRHHGIHITHHIIMFDDFKGAHDTVGKDPIHLV